MAVSKYDWDFIRPLDQTATIAAMSQGNQQINAGLAGMGEAVNGYASAMKQRNTDDILNALMKAQTTEDLPNAMNAVQALQQQYGRGYDQAAVRDAVDQRGQILGQRDLQNINLQQAQAAQAALPQIQAFNATRLGKAGATAEQLAAFNGIQGIDTTNLANAEISGLQSDRTYNRGVFESDRNYNRQVSRDAVDDGFRERENRRADLNTASSIAKEYVTPGTSGWTTDENGNQVFVNSGGIEYSQALPALMNSLFRTESNLQHRDSNGNLTRSPKGALGIAQIMPTTAAKPGYGMKPINLQTSTAQEQQEWATQYITRIQKAHNFSTPQAVAAYNAGAGRVQQAIKKGGSNWLAYMPQETQNYVPKVLGGARQGSATAALGPMVSQANMSKVTGGYQQALAKLEGDYSAQSAKDQVKGSLATTGKNVDTWAADKKDSGLIFSSNNSFFTKASDLAKMAKADPAFNKLPETAQINVLNGAYAKLNDVNAFQYVPDGDLKKFISRESQQYSKDRINQHAQAKNALFENTYQQVVAQYQAVGGRPPSRESVRQMLDPQYKPAATPKAKAAPSPAKQAVKAVAPKPTQTKASQTQTQIQRNNAEREKRKKAEWEKVLANNPQKAKKEVQKEVKKFSLGSGTTHLSKADLDKMMKNIQMR